MGRAGDARIVVADGLLALAGELSVVEVEPGLREGAQVGLDGRLVLRRGRHDLGRGDDAVRAEPAQPGRVHRFVVDQPGGGPARAASSHGLGLDDAISLAVALDRMPGRLIVHAIEAADLAQGPGLTPAVAAAVGPVASAVLDDIGAGRRPG